MVTLPGFKFQKESKIQRIPSPEIVRFSLQDQMPCVSQGETIYAGQRIATPKTDEQSNKTKLFSPLNGSVQLLTDTEILLRGEWPLFPKITAHQNIATLLASEIITLAKEAGLCGMGGGEYPTYKKLSTSNKIHTILVNGCESEPYLTGDYRVLAEFEEEVQCGLNVAMRAVNATQGQIVFEKNSYVSGYERFLVEETLGCSLPQGTRPQEAGVLVINVQTARALHRAVCEKRVLLERVLTIEGGAISKPGNYEVPLGTEVGYVLKCCGILPEKCAQLIIGGPMMGKPAEDSTTITAGTCGILALTEQELAIQKEAPCIRCGTCLEVCPLHLPVSVLLRKPKKEILDCIECGLCQFFCPSQRPLVQQLHQTKKQLRQKK